MKPADPHRACDAARKRWNDEAPQWVSIADRLGIKLD